MRGRLRLGDLIAGARFIRRAPEFLHRTHSPEQARRIARDRLDRRDGHLLALLRRLLGPPGVEPYRGLLRRAGIEPGDFDRLIRREGVDGALRTLVGAGVYLTNEEFKGRRDVQRGSATLLGGVRVAGPAAGVGGLTLATGGSRGARAELPFDARFEQELAVNVRLFLDARGFHDWESALWEVPGGAALRHLVWLSKCGSRPTRWFSQVGLDSPGLDPRYRWSARLVRVASLLAAAPLPGPQFVGIDDPLQIARWMAERLRARRVPHVWTFVSSAVRICRAGEAAGLHLAGAQFTANGEPITAARVAAVERVGARLGGYYGSVETGPIGYACLMPNAPDDLHLLSDCHGLVQLGTGVAEVESPPATVLLTSLLPGAPAPLLNVSLGDEAEILERACGCPLEALGWRTHLRRIRSHAKVTAGGMTFYDGDLAQVLERALPERFGGGPLDYQLVEAEGPGGDPDVRLSVSPALGPLDADRVREAFLAALEAVSAQNRVMGLQWRRAGLPRLERAEPRATAAGKTLHIHRVPAHGDAEPGRSRDLPGASLG